MQVKWESQPFGVDDLEPGAAEGYQSAASPLRKDGEVRCCIRACRTWMPRRTRKGTLKFCPDHGISTSTSPTYVYKDWRRNILLQRDLMAMVKEHKYEAWRLGNEGSEDALSWNVFVGIAYLGALREAFEVLTGLKAREEPQLFFWGVEVWPTYRTGVWSKLADAQDYFEKSVDIQTEPDVMLRVAGQALVLVEAKFGSPNGTLAKKKSGVSLADFLNQYRQIPGRADPLDRNAMMGLPPEQVLEQLCRNVVFANRLVESNEEPFVANLVRGTAETDVKERMARHLSTEARAKFRRVTWEDIGCLHSLQGDKASPLRKYLRTKTLNLQVAFKMS